jgi:cytochrome bd-type quinol oxidase subunit 2
LNKQCATNSNGTDVNSLLKTIINILSLLVGAIAVIMIIIGGFRYVTSAGNDSNTAAARKTIMYALIGLVIVALAQVIVHFVLNNLT